MKKLLISLLFLTVAISISYADTENRPSATPPVNFRDQTGQRLEAGAGFYATFSDNRNIHAFAPSISLINYPARKTGFGLYSTFIIPLSINEGHVLKRQDYTALFGVDFIAGFTFMLYSSPTFRLPVTVGPHYAMMWMYSPLVDFSCYSIGAGANITGEFHVARHFYLYVRLQTHFDFYHWDKSVDNNGNISHFSRNTRIFGFNPSAGVALRF